MRERRFIGASGAGDPSALQCMHTAFELQMSERAARRSAQLTACRRTPHLHVSNARDLHCTAHCTAQYNVERI